MEEAAIRPHLRAALSFGSGITDRFVSNHLFQTSDFTNLWCLHSYLDIVTQPEGAIVMHMGFGRDELDATAIIGSGSGSWLRLAVNRGITTVLNGFTHPVLI